MRNPVELEERFRELVHSLSFPASARQRLNEIRRFVDESAESDYIEPYLIELTDQLSILVGTTDFSGGDPNVLQSFHSVLISLQRRFPSLATIDSFLQALRQICFETARLFAYAGEIQNAAQLLDGSESSSSEWLNAIQHKTKLPPRLRLERARQTAEGHSRELAESLNRLEAEWMVEKANSVTVPVVEIPVRPGSNSTVEGNLRRVSLEVFGPSTKSSDTIHSDVAVFGPVGSTESVLTFPIAAAHALIAETHQHLSNLFITGQLTFDRAHAMHQGSSANLGIAALIYCGILRYANERNQYSLKTTAAMTGNVNPDGMVGSVESKHLATKVQAVFFSPSECLVVPKQQLPEAEAFLAKYSQRFPRRPLTIIGVQHLRELFFDRRLTELRRIPFPRHAVKRIWKWRMPIAGAIILTLAVVIWRLWYGPLNKNPVGYRFEGEMLYLKNKDDATVDEIRVGRKIVDQFYDEAWRDVGVSIVTFADIDADGINEVFWVQPSSNGEDCTTINCKSVGEKSRWSFLTQKALHFPNSTDVNSENFWAFGLLVDDFDGDGKLEVFSQAWNLPFFPCVVFKLDATTGGELGYYVNTGPVNSLHAADLDADGVKEVLALGLNNAFRDVCVAVFDPRFIGGHSPLTKAYVVEGYESGIERAYIRIPRSVVGKAFATKSKGNMSRSLVIEESSRKFRVRVNDVFVNSAQADEKMSAELIAYFNFDLAISNCGSADDYDLLYEHLVEGKRIPDVPRNEYLTEYRKTILYWDGEAWQNKPVFNKRYLKTLQEAGLPPPKGFAFEAPK